jgi:hypothetical protein
MIIVINTEQGTVKEYKSEACATQNIEANLGGQLVRLDIFNTDNYIDLFVTKLNDKKSLRFTLEDRTYIEYDDNFEPNLNINMSANLNRGTNVFRTLCDKLGREI